MVSGYSVFLCLGQSRWSGRREWPPQVPDATMSPRHETSAQEQSGDVKDARRSVAGTRGPAHQVGCDWLRQLVYYAAICWSGLFCRRVHTKN